MSYDSDHMHTIFAHDVDHRVGKASGVLFLGTTIFHIPSIEGRITLSPDLSGLNSLHDASRGWSTRAAIHVPIGDKTVHRSPSTDYTAAH